MGIFFRGAYGAPQTPSWGTRTLRVLVNAALYIFSSGNFILDSLWAPRYICPTRTLSRPPAHLCVYDFFFNFFFYNQSKKRIYNITVSTNTPIQYGIYCQNVYNYIHIHKYIHTYIYIYIYIHTHTHTVQSHTHLDIFGYISRQSHFMYMTYTHRYIYINTVKLTK